VARRHLEQLKVELELHRGLEVACALIRALYKVK
jgi:hypothetical protein